MKKLILFTTVLFLVSSSLQAETFFFLGEEDNFYENPANWYPAYPGTIINNEDTVFLQADAFFQGYNLEVSGNLEITLGATLSSSAGSVIIQPTGYFNNEGEVQVFAVNNYGKVNNNISATMHVEAFHSYTHSVTNNFLSASFMVIRDVANYGTINNYGYFAVGQNLENRNVFNHLGHAELSVDNILYLGSGSKINQATHARIETGKKVQLPTYGTIVQSSALN